jgi:hypothetical protein
MMGFVKRREQVRKHEHGGRSRRRSRRTRSETTKFTVPNEAA